ncbi:type II toxin-antitoxin system RelE/ParE family toxin [Candidatus Micrarchaeota archaeon]|nr:type II toxin-antitoxin system RelE/ParE family toxin [Candidatus Micrarchaeota archaeon]
MPIYFSAFSHRFLGQLKKLDRRQKELVFKRIEKILRNPEMGKPLHAPLANYLSERFESHRIIFKIRGSTVEFAWLDKRKRVYE